LILRPLLLHVSARLNDGRIDFVDFPGGKGERLFALMPAFDLEGGAAVKLATFFPDNGLPTIQSAIVLFSTVLIRRYTR
jgi:ornithine cyclodeaminase/alanine dehydrogenase-like protein (mu-crystallin family)